MQLTKSRFLFLATRGVQLDNGVTPPSVHASLCWCSLLHSKCSLKAFLTSTTLSSPPILMALTHTRRWAWVRLLGCPPIEGTTWGAHLLQVLEHVLWEIPKILTLHACYAHAATRIYHSTSSPTVMLSWAKTSFTTIRETVLRDHTTNQKWEEEP